MLKALFSLLKSMKVEDKHLLAEQLREDLLMNEDVFIAVNALIPAFTDNLLVEFKKAGINDELNRSQLILYALGVVNEMVEAKRFDDITKGFGDTNE
jgi:hypothetical protein